MAVVIIDSLTKEDIKNAREDYSEYIKITIDVEKELVAIGGEYHADAEAELVNKYQSKNGDIWGGGYNITLRKFETNAMINIKSFVNDSPEILNPEIRENFLKIAKEKLKDIESLT